MITKNKNYKLYSVRLWDYESKRMRYIGCFDNKNDARQAQLNFIKSFKIFSKDPFRKAIK